MVVAQSLDFRVGEAEALGQGLEDLELAVFLFNLEKEVKLD